MTSLHYLLWITALDCSVKATGGLCLGFRDMIQEGHHRPSTSCFMAPFITIIYCCPRSWLIQKGGKLGVIILPSQDSPTSQKSTVTLLNVIKIHMYYRNIINSFTVSHSTGAETHQLTEYNKSTEFVLAALKQTYILNNATCRCWGRAWIQAISANLTVCARAQTVN